MRTQDQSLSTNKTKLWHGASVTLELRRCQRQEDYRTCRPAIVNPKFSERPCLTKQEGRRLRMILNTELWLPHAHGYICIPIHVYTCTHIDMCTHAHSAHTMTHAHTLTCAHMNTCTHARTCTHAHTLTPAHILMYTHNVHTYTKYSQTKYQCKNVY